ncbi:MAG TPA: hypothetical protein VJT75_01345, partial [Thermoleophilaceae bacterium]|nr:hypothetical protein [Thermoleophilaceae bacterium]
MAAPHVNHTLVVRARHDEVRRELLRMAEIGVGGYKLIGETPDGLALRKRSIPGWAIALAVLFPIPGILFLLARREDIVTVSLGHVPEGTRVAYAGRASTRLQQALQGMLGQWQIAGAPAPRWAAAALP